MPSGSTSPATTTAGTARAQEAADGTRRPRIAVRSATMESIAVERVAIRMVIARRARSACPR